MLTAALEQTGMKVDDILQEHSVDIEMTILTLALLVHHADEVAKPVYLLVLLFRSEIETLDIILLIYVAD